MPDGSMARCRSCTYSWRARARPSARSRRSGSTTRARYRRTSKPLVQARRVASESCLPAATARTARCIISAPILPTTASRAALFSGRYQPQYDALFRKSRPIDFGIGYRWRPNESNLLLAVRKPESASEALVEPTLEKDRAETTQTVETNRNSTVRQRRAGYPQTFRWPLDWLRLSR